MIAAAVRQTADWLGDATYGVNALRSSVPRDPSEPAPAAVEIFDETREGWVARGKVPRTKTSTAPMLLVRGPEEADVPLFGTQGNGGYTDCEVRVFYVRRAPAAAVDTDDAVRDALQTLRIAARSIAHQYQTQQANPSRMSVQLDRPTARFIRAFEALADDGELVIGALSLTFPAVDPWAMAAIP